MQKDFLVFRWVNFLTQNAHLTAKQASLIEIMEFFTPFLFTNFGSRIVENSTRLALEISFGKGKSMMTHTWVH